MSDVILVGLVLVLTTALILLRMPVGIALGLGGGFGLLMLRDASHVLRTIASTSFTQTHTFTLTIIPMFILMGIFAVHSGIAKDVFAVASRLFGKLPGGLAIATVMACAAFAAVSGSSIGTAATMSRLSVREMARAGYPLQVASATVAVAGTLGAMIPPSLFLVVYAIISGESVGAMLAAGIIPGILSAIAYAIYLFFRMRKVTLTPSSPGMGDALESATNAKGPLPWGGVVKVGILFAIIMGGIYSGLFTATESAAIGAVAALIMLVVSKLREGARAIGNGITESFKEAASTTSMVFLVILGSGILSAFFVLAGVPDMLADAVLGMNMPGWLTMAMLLAVLIPMGMVLESMSMLVIAVPLIYPVAEQLGFNGILLGVLMVKLIEIGMVTPPVGINCYVVAGTSGVKATTVFKGIWPFVAVELLICVLLFVFPALSLALPALIRN
ncbi:MAG TPA: TRAP transporter large permease [Propionibacterium sp.]|nr:TRAP transporter large permease [Propionibacterium sp.]